MAIITRRDNEVSVTFEGAVLQLYEHNGYDDSDFYAVVYDAGTDTLVEVMHATTRCYSLGMSATVDATPEVQARAREILFEQKIMERVDAARVAAREVVVGREVAVKATKSGKGRKFKGVTVDAGARGRCFWVGVDRYSRDGMRVGVEFADGLRVFGSETVFEVVDPEQFEVSAAEVRDSLIGPECINTFHQSRAGVPNLT